jgi:phenylpropionate dioxygenase-like ring-hydroxylating dioxygenase large terminal subunit
MQDDTNDVVIEGRPDTSDVLVEGRPGPLVQDVLRADTRKVPQHLLDDGNDFTDDSNDEVDVQRYLSADYYKLEVERLWGKVWQIACHEDQIQNVGDYVVYEIADKSFIVVRTAPDTIKAFYNACLHRGRMLCERDGHAHNLRCKFHGFAWRLDGSLAAVPSRWDFPNIRDQDFRLPEAKVGRWLGFVFINMDLDAAPLETYLGDLPQHFKDWRFEHRRLVGHVGKVIRANWKVCAEAFLEFFHGTTTHPQAVGAMSDVNTRYVVRKGKHYSHMLMPTGIASPFVANTLNEQQVLDTVVRQFEIHAPAGKYALPSGKTARQHYADMQRERLAAATGRDFSRVSDSEMVDGWVYSLFPNITLWGAYFSPFWYRFRPWQNNPEMTLMEIFIMPELPEGAPRPPAPKMTLLGPDQDFTQAPEFGELGEFFNQDLGNLEWVQRGLHATKRDKLVLARYQESENRQFNRTLDAYMRGDAPARK